METTTFAILFPAARLILGAVFLMSATPKLVAPRRFANDVQQYGILPRRPYPSTSWNGSNRYSR